MLETICVTGANGTVGSRVVAELARSGANVRALVRSLDRGTGIASPGVELVAGEFGHPGSLNSAFAGAAPITFEQYARDNAQKFSPEDGAD